MIRTLTYITGGTFIIFCAGAALVAHAQFQFQATPVAEPVTAIPAHTPEWTDTNESDPGVTIMEVSEVLLDTETDESSAVQQGRSILDSDSNENADAEHKEWIEIESMSSPGAIPGTKTTDIGAPEVDPGGIEHEDIGITDLHDSAIRKESGEKGGTTDMNIGIGELQEMNKADLIDSLATEPIETRAVFVKYGDIKGESDDEATDSGVNEIGMDDGSATAAKKPKEIVVVGSRVRGWDPVKKEEIIGIAPTDPEAVSSAEDLALFLTAGIDADARIEEVTFNYEKIQFDYDTQVKLLGMFAVPVKASYEMDMEGDPEDLGRIKVQMPWWHVFGRKTVRPHDFLTAAAGLPDDENENTRAARLFQTISNTLKASHR